MALFNLWTIAVTAIALVIIRLIARAYQVYKKFQYYQNLPGEREYSLLYGNLHKFPKEGEARINWTRDLLTCDPSCRKLMRYWHGPFLPAIAVYHPDTVKPILNTHLPKARGFGLGIEFLAKWLGDGLVCTNDRALWHRNRKMLTSAFHCEVLKSYNASFNSACDVMMEKLSQKAENGDSFDITDVVSLCVFEGILRCAMGCGEDVQKENSSYAQYVQAVRKLIEGWTTRVRNVWMWPDLIFNLCPTGRSFNSCLEYIHSFDDDIIKSRRESLLKYGRPKNRKMDFMEVLLTARDDEGRSLTDKEIREEVDTFMAAGYDTTASATPWLLYNLAKHPDYQRKVQDELDRVVSNDHDTDTNPEHITWHDLSQVPLLSQCVKESIRLYPPIPYVLRVLPTEVVLDGRIIPKGTLISIFINTLHRHPDLWDFPDRFLPERFSNDNARLPFSYIPFSAGPRNCIGQSFAMNEMRVITGRILKRFNIELDPKAPKVERSDMLILKPTNGIWVGLSKRKQPETRSHTSDDAIRLASEL